jgi:hypothetical protein
MINCIIIIIIVVIILHHLTTVVSRWTLARCHATHVPVTPVSPVQQN